MLLIDDEQISRADLCKKFGISLDKIEKNPVFENIEARKTRQGKVVFGAGIHLKSSFPTRDPETKMEIRVRYAQSVNNTKVGDKLDKTYKPNFVNYQGGIFAKRDDLDLAVFMALNPSCKSSPLSASYRGRKRYTFLDRTDRAIDELKSMDVQDKATFHAKNLKFDELVIFAKGLKINGVDAMDEPQLRVEVRKFAINHTDRYIQSIDSTLVKVEGRVRDLVDKKAFVLEKINNIRQWRWAKGAYEGEIIGTQITNPLVDAVESLINYILSNPETYILKIFEAVDSISAREKARSFLDNVELPESVSEALKPSSGDLYVDLPNPEIHEDVKNFFEDHGYKKIPTDIKNFKEAISSGLVKQHDALVYMDKNYQKADTA